MYDSYDCSEPDFGYQTGIFAWLEEKIDQFDRWIGWLFMFPYMWVALIPTKRNKRLAEKSISGCQRCLPAILLVQI